jgi:hypothetical protein
MLADFDNEEGVHAALANLSLVTATAHVELVVTTCVLKRNGPFARAKLPAAARAMTTTGTGMAAAGPGWNSSSTDPAP